MIRLMCAHAPPVSASWSSEWSERCVVGEVIIEGSRTGHAPRKYEQRESNVRGRDQF